MHNTIWCPQCKVWATTATFEGVPRLVPSKKNPEVLERIATPIFPVQCPTCHTTLVEEPTPEPSSTD